MSSAIETVTLDLNGELRLVASEPIRDASSEREKEAAARRRVVAAGGTCPCGARLRRPNRAARRAATRSGSSIAVDVWHRADCVANTGGGS